MEDTLNSISWILKLVCQGKDEPFEIAVEKVPFTIGKSRNEVDGIITGSRAVSRIHCTIFKDGDGYAVRDNGSRNGTFRNGVRLNAGESARLETGDYIRLADLEFVVVLAKSVWLENAMYTQNKPGSFEDDANQKIQEDLDNVVYGRDRVIIEFEIACSHIVSELDIPLDISANEFVVSLNRIYSLGIDENDAKETFLRCQYPEVLLNGEKSLADFGVRSGTRVVFGSDTRFTKIERDREEIKRPNIPDLSETGYPCFVRNTRLKTVVNEDPVEILDPPAKPEKPKNNLILRLLPALGMLAAAGIMAYVGGRMLIISIMSAGIGILTSVLSIIEARKDHKKACREREEKYRSYIEKKQSEIDSIRETERSELSELYPALPELLERLGNFDSDLFDRQLTDKDFLNIRLGIGRPESLRRVVFKKSERLEIDQLQNLPELLSVRNRYLTEAPVISDLKIMNGLGIAGDDDDRYEFMKYMVIDLAIRHFWSDVHMAFATTGNNRDKIYSLRSLPHVRKETYRMAAWDESGVEQLFDILYKELSARKQSGFQDHLIIFIYDECGFMRHPLSKYLHQAAELGTCFVFLRSDKSQIPQGCAEIIELKGKNEGIAIPAEDKRKRRPFTYEKISEERLNTAIRLLAPLYSEEVSLEGDMREEFSIYEMLDIANSGELKFEELWERACPEKTLSAPVGISKSGMVKLNLHDRAHGPHGLVAGTTGSGKSELLQTYILSMAVHYHPHQVGFLIIDFKGGGMASQFKNLPHMLGTITNMDGKELDRSLKSIRAELERRQFLFAQCGVNHIDKYLEKCKADQVSEPLPHLMIIVDEFAELKAQCPDFMNELISASRIGRSLGIHLILATQKPSGQVSDQIWSNSRFRICLKVQSAQDSNEVIKSPLAAEIRDPGKAYLQVGNNELFELFMSAYSGGNEDGRHKRTKNFTIYQYDSSGRRVPVYSSRWDISENTETEEERVDARTMAGAIIDRIREYCMKNEIKKLPDVFLPPLEKEIAFPTNIGLIDDAGVVKQNYEQATSENKEIIASIGIYDDPDRQHRGEYNIDISNNNVMIIGSSGAGKTNILQNIVIGICRRYSPDEVNVYIIDFASMKLKGLEELPHVGGVVTPAEEEKLKNLLRLLKRRDGAGQNVLIIDNLTALRELYPEYDDEIAALCRDGKSTRVSVIAANAQTAGIGYKYLSSFSVRMGLYCNDVSEYGMLFDHCKMNVDNIPGRMIIKIDKELYQCQAYNSVEADEKFINSIKVAHKGKCAVKIPMIPEVITAEDIIEDYRSYVSGRYGIIAGLDHDTALPVILDLAYAGVLAIADESSEVHLHGGVNGNSERVGAKYEWLEYVLSYLSENSYEDSSDKSQMENGDIRVYAIDSYKRKLKFICDMENGISLKYSVGSESLASYILEIESILKDRYEKVLSSEGAVLSQSELILLVIDDPEALSVTEKSGEVQKAYENITEKYKEMNICIIIFAPNRQIPYGAAGIWKSIREGRNILFFGEVQKIRLAEVGNATMRKLGKIGSADDAILLTEEGGMMIRTPRKGIKEF